MSQAWITILTFAATSLLVGGIAVLVYELLFRYREQVQERLGALTDKGARESGTTVLDLRQLQQMATPSQGGWSTRLRELIAQAGLSMPLRSLLTLCVACGLVVAATLAVVTEHWAPAVAGFSVIGIPIFYLRTRRDARKRRLTWQLPEAFDSMARAVRAGQTIQAAFQLVGDDFEPPVCEEFRRCYEQQNLGMTYDATLRDLARRTGIMELQILVVALLVQARSGGSLADLLGNLSDMVRKRLKLQQKVKALTGEGRMQAGTLIVLPVLAFVFLYFSSPDYIGALLERPWLLGTTVAMQVSGAIWIRRIVHFEY